MEIVVAFIGTAIGVIVAAYVAQPLLVKTRVKASAEDSPREKLLAERDTVYAAIRDIDFDFQTGKLLEADYHAMRDKYAARGVELLKELDAMPEVGSQRSEVGGQRAEAADEIEAAVRARRKAKPPSQEDEIEAAVRARRRAAQGPKSETPALRAGASVRNQACPKCGRPIDPSDRFCAKCGTPLTVEATR
jgi:hypothetical protein